MPIFSKVKNNELALTGYHLNSGLSKALGAYFAGSNWRINKRFIIKDLLLDNNNLKDEDFAEIMAGLSIQGQL